MKLKNARIIRLRIKKSIAMTDTQTSSNRVNERHTNCRTYTNIKGINNICKEYQKDILRYVNA